ncbi:hypothetical protein EV421DRAFT_903510 [Armillaria borealis]|uniref:MYND-type domain-containing protein n=1 Tax=Armillaria borealis TaxID=47425 RepID=A0AA39N011_9AGAR|nr:hypothetical protein EV421DRAFT_903510 [Armillaria borealis]
MPQSTLARRQKDHDMLLINAAFKDPLNSSEILTQVRRSLSQNSPPHIPFDSKCRLPQPELHELAISLVASSACIRGICRIVVNGLESISPHILHRIIDLWPRLLPRIVYFLKAVLKEPESFVKLPKQMDTLLSYAAAAVCDGVTLSSLMLRLPSILRQSQNLISCLAQVWIVSLENRLSFISFNMPTFFMHEKSLLNVFAATIKQEIPVQRLTSVISRLVRDVDCIDIDWAAIKDGAILLRTLSNDPSLGLSLRLAKLIPWMCYVVWRVVDTPRPNTEAGEQCRMLALLTTFVSIHVGLAQGPDWIAQSLKRTHFLRSLWKFSQEDLTADLAKTIAEILNTLTINLIWRTVLRRVRISLKKLESAVDAPNLHISLRKPWATFLHVANHRWETRASLHGGSDANVCMNSKCLESSLETGNITTKIHRCSGCGFVFCSAHCQKEAGDTHRKFCQFEKNKRKDGYPDDVMQRDELFLHHIVMSDVRHEKELVATLMNNYHTKCNADTYPPVTCMDYRDAPMSISVGHWEGFRGICGIDESKLFQELERGKQAAGLGRNGKLVLSILPCGLMLKASILWVEQTSA